MDNLLITSLLNPHLFNYINLKNILPKPFVISKNPKNTHIKAMTKTKHARTEVVLLYKINMILAYFRHYTGNNSILIEQYTFNMYYINVL